MRFKSGKLSFRKHSRKISAPEVLRCALTAMIFGFPNLAGATLTIEPLSPYTFPDDDEDLVLEQVLRYSADEGGGDDPVLIDTEEGYVNLDLTQGFGTSEDEDQQVHLKLTSTTTFTDDSSSHLLVSAFVTVASSTTPIAIPIASVNGEACSESNCQGEVSSGGITYYTAARVPDETQVSALDIGFFPKDICIGVLAQNAAATVSGCTGSAINSPTTSVTTAFTLSYAVAKVTGDDDGITYSTATEKASDLSLILHGKSPSYTCPAAADIYFPGDSSILVSTDFTVVGDSANAPVDQLVVIASPVGVDLDKTATFATGNPLVGRFELGNGQKLFEGFENSTASSLKKYQVSFSVVDRTGRLSGFGRDSSCDLEEVEASEVDGFLNANDCFIASATFRSSDGFYVEVFREFRDELLRRTRLGQELIRFYYENSPQAAAWIYRYPVLRLPALAVLVPLSSFLLLLLHPLWSLAGFGGVIMALIWSSRRRGVAL